MATVRHLDFVFHSLFASHAVPNSHARDPVTELVRRCLYRAQPLGIYTLALLTHLDVIPPQQPRRDTPKVASHSHSEVVVFGSILARGISTWIISTSCGDCEAFDHTSYSCAASSSRGSHFNERPVRNGRLTCACLSFSERSPLVPARNSFARHARCIAVVLSEPLVTPPGTRYISISDR